VEGKAESELWKQLVSTYHYLGYKRAWGRRLRYLVWIEDEAIGALGWKSGALQLQSREGKESGLPYFGQKHSHGENRLGRAL